MAYRLLMLDFDGVLADSFPFFRHTFNQAAPPRLSPGGGRRTAGAAPLWPATDCPPCRPAVVEAAARGGTLCN
ncbi:MAG: hypothetical protein U1E47_07870 [Rivihabitans pingtungensis]